MSAEEYVKTNELEFGGLSEEDTAELLSVINQVRDLKQSKSEARLLRDTVPIEDWIVDEYYVGRSGLKIFPFWREEIIDIFGNNRDKYNEVIITGGLGCGKSTAGLYIMMRKMYELSCYENIPLLFDLMANTMISFIYFSVSKLQAELTGFGQFRSMIDETPYFQEFFHRDDRIQSLLKFPENLHFLHGSSTNHAIGMSIIGSILDEANFFQNSAQDPQASVREFSKISNMYSSIVGRSRSRYMGYGKDNSLCVLISSNTTQASFTDERIQKSIDNPSVKVINARVWDVRPKGYYSADRFHVFEGSDLIDPFIVESAADIQQVTDSMDISLPKGKKTVQIIDKLPAYVKDKFVSVPTDFRKEFTDNIIEALQNVAGRSVAPTGRLFNSRPVYRKACENNILRHPFSREEIVISTNSPLVVKDYLLSGFRPIRRDKKRYIHIDQSTSNDSTGFASAYHSRDVEIDDILKPVIAVDIQIKINPPKPPHKISIAKVRDFVFFMRDVWGLEIGGVSYDWWGSQESIQTLDENGIKASHLSVDRTDEAYLTFVNMLYEERLEIYNYKPAEKELFELIHFRDKHKVDHANNGSKDIMDAVVGAVWGALQDIQLRPLKHEDIDMAFDIGYSSDEDEMFTMDELLGGSDGLFW